MARTLADFLGSLLSPGSRHAREDQAFIDAISDVDVK
jgi:hypothetical protein